MMKSKTLITALAAVAIVFAFTIGTVGLQVVQTAFADNGQANGQGNGQGPGNGQGASNQGPGNVPGKGIGNGPPYS